MKTEEDSIGNEQDCEDNIETLSSDDELLQKRVFMVEEDKEYRVKKRLEKEREKGEAKLALWAKW